ncbi:MAG: flagellar hook-associated protein FlgL [Pseudomonadota bacterium]
MRISTSQIFTQGLNGFQQQQVHIARLQLQLSSGQKHLRPSDDPAEVARSLELEQIVSRTQQYLDNMDAAESRLSLEESSLSSANDSLVRVRELAVQGASTLLSDDARRALVAELRQRFDELHSLANTVDSHGDYIFAGNQGNDLPFVTRTVADYTVVDFVGDQNNRSVQVTETDRIETSDSGSDVFMKIRSSTAVHMVADLDNTGTAAIAPVFVRDSASTTGDDYRIVFTSANTYDIINDTTTTTVSAGNAYVSGQAIEFDGVRTTLTGAPANGDEFRIRPAQYQDVFTTVNKMILALEEGTTDSTSRARLSAAMTESLDDIDNALDNINEYRTRIGGRMNVMEGYRDQSEGYLIDTQSAISLLRDVDYAEAVTKLQQHTLSLQAAQAAFARIQDQSLFNYF